MGNLIWAVVAVALLLVIAVVLKRLGLLDQPGRRAGPNAADAASLCSLRPELLSASERAFWSVLQTAVGTRYAIFPKMRVGDILKVEGQGSKPTSARNRIQQKHADFVLCDPKTTKPVLVIELDDSSHRREDRRQRDDFVDQAYAQAGLPILHVPAIGGYAPARVIQDIERIIARPAAKS